MLAPWTALWEHNWFARLWPPVQAAMDSAFVRGAVSGVGLVTVAAGIRELFGVFAGSASSDADAGTGPTSPQ
jgi:hypothetical protein